MPKMISKKMKPVKTIIIVVCIIVIALLSWLMLKPKTETPQYITAEVGRGDIENSVLATGILEATKMVRDRKSVV